MAQKVTVQLLDDVDGSKADETVVFNLDGTSFEIDLSAAHAAQLRDSLTTFVSVARKKNPKGVAVATKRTRVGADPKTVRAWAKSNGVAVTERGRISQTVIDQFEAANA